ncbi:Cytochrome c oxidase assembly protein COX19 [Diplonema papillatum]|nr:Cytochrome c oxidase assembly protein COX19 [Diplonema papillatum]
MARVTPTQIVRPPEKGSFPLDHLNECRGTIEEYFRCLARWENLAPKCREEARTYLRCRMEKDLMDAENTDKWLPDTEFIDVRDVKRKEKMNTSDDLSPLVAAARWRAMPDGFEKPRSASNGDS